jgi:integrase
MGELVFGGGIKLTIRAWSGTIVLKAVFFDLGDTLIVEQGDKHLGEASINAVPQAEETLPFIPSEREIDDLIAATSKYIAAFLQICKESAGRSGEVSRLRWTDVDFENASVRITPEKGSKPRLAKLSNKAIQMLNQLNRNHETMFIGHYKNSRNLLRTFLRQRKRDETKALIEAGFQYVCENDGLKFFRKLK